MIFKRLNAIIAAIIAAIVNAAIISAASLSLTSCAYFMPAEIRDIEKRNQTMSDKVTNEHPQAFHDAQGVDRKIHYVQLKENGDTSRPWIVFVHGSPGEWQGWSEFLLDEDLLQKANLIAVDRPGFGGSGAGDVERSLVRQAQDVMAVLDHIPKAAPIILVGHSFGGPVISRLAMDHPERFSDLLILAGSIDPDQEKTEWYQYPADWLVFSWMVPQGLRMANREIMPLKGELTEMLPLWTKVTQRVSVIQGDEDDLVPPANADFAQKMLVNANYANIIRIPKMNHFLPWKQYAVIKAELVKHLAEAGPTADHRDKK